jgi:ubiquinone/menaquinone biosynthesis C-methylase UbiE
LPRLYREEDVQGTDRLLRYLYDALPRFHNPAVTYLLPLVEFGRESTLRNGYMKRLELSALARRPRSRGLRILEVGIGAGANLTLLRRDLPPQVEAEVWGCDLSLGMLDQCRRVAARLHWPKLKLVVADAHALPFPEHSFDRVFHVGGIGAFRDPRTALAEMARVARPGTPVVVVDEQLDRARWNTLYHKLAFKVLTFYDPSPHCPREHLPADCHDVVEEQISRFYYCLSFKRGKEEASR